MSVAASGNTILRIAVALRMVIVELQTGSEAVLAEIRWATASELRNETSVDKAAISGVTTALATGEV